MRAKQPTILVIIGVTGDLSRRKLLPAIEQIARAEYAPDQLRIVGISRSDVDTNELIGDRLPFVRQHFEPFRMDIASGDDYAKLSQRLTEIDAEFGGGVQRLFYLSIPPQASRLVVRLLGEAGFGNDPATKLMLEKPFGVDLESAKELVAETTKYFTESQVYRIDHYLAKEMAQNIIVFRQGNSLFQRTWNNDFIERVEIVASEAIGIEGRSAFYEQTGALRDLVQSHLLQLAALVLMQLPDADNTVAMRRQQALRQLRVSPDTGAVKRAQYKGYRADADNDRSTTETFVRLQLESTDEQWRHVPIFIVTGKALAQKQTLIRIVYKKTDENQANDLVIALQPHESIAVDVWAKVPGYDRRQEKHRLEFALGTHFESLPEAYEQVIVDAMQANHELFASSDEVLESWRILQPILERWEMNGDDLYEYEKGATVANLQKSIK